MRGVLNAWRSRRRLDADQGGADETAPASDRDSMRVTGENLQTPLDTDFEGMSTNRAAYCASLERLQFRGRCALAREVLERHQRLGAHARVVVVEQFAQVRHGDLDSGVSRPEAPEVPSG